MLNNRTRLITEGSKKGGQRGHGKLIFPNHSNI